MHRPSEREFLSAVLEDLEDLPEGFASRLMELLDDPTEDRSRAIATLIEELTNE